MKLIPKMIVILSLIILVSCEKSDDPIVINSDKLVGYWLNPVLIDTIWKYERAGSLKDNEYGFSIKSGQKFMERKNSGWCGTPPVSYADYNGTWAIKDSVINVTVDYWGGMVDYHWKIVSVDNHFLTIYRFKEEYHNLEK